MAQFFRVQPDERVKSLNHSIRLSKSDRHDLEEAYGKQPVKVFAVYGTHKALANIADNSVVTSRTLWSLGVKSHHTSGELLTYTMSEATVFFDETRNRFYAPAKVARVFFQALSDRVRKTMMPKPKKETKRKANVTARSRMAVDAAMQGWSGSPQDQRVLQMALQVHAELCEMRDAVRPTETTVALRNEGQADHRVPKHLRSTYRRMCRKVRAYVKEKPKGGVPPLLASIRVAYLLVHAVSLLLD